MWERDELFIMQKDRVSCGIHTGEVYTAIMVSIVGRELTLASTVQPPLGQTK